METMNRIELGEQLKNQAHQTAQTMKQFQSYCSSLFFLFLSYMNLFSLGLVGEPQLFTHHLVRFSSNAIQVTGGELPWLIWGGRHSHTIFEYCLYIF